MSIDFAHPLKNVKVEHVQFEHENSAEIPTCSYNLSVKPKDNLLSLVKPERTRIAG